MSKTQGHIINMRNPKTGTVLKTFKNKKQNPDKLKLRKFDKKIRKHVEFTESKK
jgi:ribosomal protein L33